MLNKFFCFVLRNKSQTESFKMQNKLLYLNECGNGIYGDLMIKNKNMELINSNKYKQLGAYISYNTFSTAGKEN